MILKNSSLKTIFYLCKDCKFLVLKYLLLLILIFKISFSYSQEEKKNIKITHLTGNFYVHTSFKLLNNVPFPSNGLFAITEQGVYLFDTPWDEEQTVQLTDSIEKRFHKKIILCVVTHSHDDRTAGLDVLKKYGVRTYSSEMTKKICIEKKEKTADFIFLKDTVFSENSFSFETFYPGEGHTKDNIVIWFPEARILYGACIVKSVESWGLGNVKDANLDEWPKSIFRIIDKYPDISYVIPGHMKWSGKKALIHTLKLLKKIRD